MKLKMNLIYASLIMLPGALACNMATTTATGATAATESVATQFISGAIDLQNNSITLPLHQGSLQDGRTVWYVLTDVSDQATSQQLGIGYSPALATAANTDGTRTATFDSAGNMIFNTGSVDFSPVHSVTPGQAPNLFPPVAVQPGSQASADYSPLVRVTKNDGSVIVYDAPIVAFNVNADQISFCDGNVDYSLVHDHVLSICPNKQQVTLSLARGYSQGKSLVYLTFDANIPLASTLESDTDAPALSALLSTGAILPLYAVTNGQTGANNPERQGFDSALSGDGSPLNVLASFPTLAGGYSPLWDIQGVQWTPQAVAASQPHALKSASDVFAAFQAGQLTGLGGGAIKTLGILVNCPAVAILQ